MASLGFDRPEFENLARKISFQARLSEPEQALLLAIFSAARDHVVAVAPVAGSGHAERTAEQLLNELVNSFIPGEHTTFIIADRIGRTPLPVPLDPPPPTTPPKSDPADASGDDPSSDGTQQS